MRIKMNTLGVAVALAVSGAAQAGTSAISFDTNGAAAGGVVNDIGSFDWTQDNALAVGAVPVSTNPGTPTTFDLYAQASLGNFVDSNNQAIAGTGLNSTFEITVQTGFTEIGIASVIPGFNATAYFQDPAVFSVNFFKIYYDTSMNANQIAGTGYGDGIEIFSGFVVNNNTVFATPFTTDSDGDGVLDTPTIGLLDNFGADDQNGTLTVFGSGGGDLSVDKISQDFAYFLTTIQGLTVDLLFNTSNITPFSQANPSDLVVGNAPVYGNLGGTPTNGFADCGSVNPPCDFQFQADANNSFYTVPEPGSLLLLGAGLMGMGWAARRRKA